MEFGINCSPAQMRKLKSGGAVTLKSNNFVEGSPHRLMVMPQTARRIQTAMKKMKGVRVALKPEEDLVAMTEGGQVSLKEGGSTYAQRLARRTRNTFKPVAKAADVVKKGFEKEIVDSGVGKEIAKGLIRTGTQVVLPTALGALSMMAGDPTGMSGQAVGQIAGNELQRFSESKGLGLFKTLHKLGAHKIGITKKSVIKAGKDLGKIAVREGAKAAGEAITAYTGNPIAGKAFEKIAVAGGDKAIESGSARKSLSAGVKQGKRIGVEIVDDYIDNNLSGVEREVAQNALAGKYPSAKDLVYDYGNSKIEEAINPVFSGYGIPRKTRGGLRMGKGLAHLTPAYSVAMRSATTGAGFRVADDRMVTPASAPSSVIQTGSPFQRINSPAMSPYIPSSPQLVNQSVGRSGGSFLPAGRMGGSFMPSG